MTDSIIPLLSSVLRNLLGVLSAYGLDTPPGTDFYDLAEEVIRIKKNGGFSEKDLQDHYKDFFLALSRYEKFKDLFVQNLTKTLEPKNFGIDRQWKKTQREALHAMIYVIQEGFTRPVSEIPTGGGKSMVLGAIARAYYDTLAHFGMTQEIVLVTSRVNLVDQLIELVVEEDNYDEPLDIGDVRIWFAEFSENDIRILAGSTSNNEAEIAKQSKITIVTYHGVTPERVALYFPRPVGLVLLDECHRVTERVKMCLNQWRALFFGYSATVIGSQVRSPFQFFDPIAKSEEELMDADSHTELFAYFKSVIEMIRNGELKPVRWLNAKTKIDLSGIRTNGSPYAQRSVFNEQSVSEILTRYAEAGFEVIREAYLGDHSALELSGSKPVIERMGLVSVHRVSLAKYYVERCNNELLPELREKYGPNVNFKAGFVSGGKMSEKEFNKAMSDYEKGIITLMFTSEKISEGADVPGINMIIILRALGLGSQWKLKQFLGRGTRINLLSPDDDLLVIDGVFQSKQHNLASVFGILGQTSAFSGGLLLGNKARTELENKVFTLLNQGLTRDEIVSILDEEELLLLLDLNIINLKPAGPAIGHHDQKISPFRVRRIDFVEREDVKFNLALDNPKELARLVMVELQKQGYCSEEHLRRFQPNLLLAFQQRMFGGLGRGIDIVNLITGRNEISLRDNVRLFEEFIRTLVLHGMPLTGNGPIKSEPVNHLTILGKEEIVWKDVDGDPVADLVSFCRDRFGIEPEFSTTNRILPSFGWTAKIAVSQASFRLGEYQAMSKPHTAITKQISRKLAAEELLAILKEDVGSQELDLSFGSHGFNIRISALWKILGKNGMNKVDYKVEKLDDDLWSYVACYKKGKRIIEGKPAHHHNEEIAKIFSLSNLFEQFHERAGFPNVFNNITTPTYENLIKQICQERGIVVEYDEQELNPPYPLYSCTARAVAPGRKALNGCESLEVYKTTAREYASKHLYNLLLATNYPPPLKEAPIPKTPTPAKANKPEGPYPSWVVLNKLKQEKLFKMRTTLEKLSGPGNMMNVSVIVEINRDGKSTVFESKTIRTGVKMAGLNRAAAELVPIIKDFFNHSLVIAPRH